MSTDLNSYNAEGQAHGYWESYYSNGNLIYKGEYINRTRHGPWERYQRNGELSFKGTYNLGEKVGFWIEGPRKRFYATQ